MCIEISLEEEYLSKLIKHPVHYVGSFSVYRQI
jgi:hypothetical protein